MRPSHFADRLAALTEERRSRVVLGLDPDPSRLWPEALARIGGSPLEGGEAQAGAPPAGGGSRSSLGGAGPGGPRTSPHLARVRSAEAVTEHCRAAIVAAGPACVAVKPQLACFERLGAPGWDALEQVAAIARDHGLLVLADGKRGDVPVTAHAYAQALVGETEGPFGAVQGLGADAFTANPLLGRDAIGPFVEAAADRGAGCFLLVRTSNPGAAELQDAGDPPLHERLARLVDELGAERVGECGLSCVGAVTGATRPDHLARLRELMPRAIFLLPGVGAQGGRVEDLGPAFAPHPAAGLVTASRSIVDAHLERGGEPAVAAEAAAEDLRASAWNL